MDNFSGGKPPDPQMSLCKVFTFVLEKCFSIDDLHLKNIWFIVSKEVEQLRFVKFEFTYSTRQLET